MTINVDNNSWKWGFDGIINRFAITTGPLQARQDVLVSIYHGVWFKTADSWIYRSRELTVNVTENSIISQLSAAFKNRFPVS